MEYKIVRTKRRSVALQITRKAEIVVRAPLFMAAAQIEAFVKKHEPWIEKNLEKQKSRYAHNELTHDEVAELLQTAREVIPQRVQHFAALMLLAPTGVKITSAQTRFGSCSSKNSLCFSYQLMKYPMEAVDYVVVHELAHITHKNHGKQFYALIEKYMPDYKSRILLLRK